MAIYSAYSRSGLPCRKAAASAEQLRCTCSKLLGQIDMPVILKGAIELDDMLMLESCMQPNLPLHLLHSMHSASTKIQLSG